MFEFRKLVMFLTSSGSILLSSTLCKWPYFSEGIKLAMCTPEELLIKLLCRRWLHLTRNFSSFLSGTATYCRNVLTLSVCTKGKIANIDPRGNANKDRKNMEISVSLLHSYVMQIVFINLTTHRNKWIIIIQARFNTQVLFISHLVMI